MKQISDVETTMSSRPSLNTLLMVYPRPRRCGKRFVFIIACGGQQGALLPYDDIVSVIEFYDRHPINEAQVLAAVARRRGSGTTSLRASDLFDFDQDHYGGLAAVETLARRASVAPTARVLDVCAGLGGPARFLAYRFGCRVAAVELNSGRAAGAARLTRLVGLDRHVVVARADATALPFANARFDACLSQEAFLHIADKATVLAECRRVVR